MLAAGCIFSPPKDDGGGGGGGGGGPYPDRTSPQQALENLQRAYQERDSLYVKEVYDSSYVGESRDLKDPPESQLTTLYYADEVDHVAALRRTLSIKSVVFNMGSRTSWTRLSSDDPSHPEWAEIQITSWFVEIWDDQTLYTAHSINPITFYFKPLVAAPGDTLWKIVKWTEIGQTTDSGSS